MLQLRRFLLHAAHALFHRRRPAGTAPPVSGERGLAGPAGSSGAPARPRSSWRGWRAATATSRRSGSPERLGSLFPSAASDPSRRFPCYCVTGRRRNTWLQPPRRSRARRGSSGPPRLSHGRVGAAPAARGRLPAGAASQALLPLSPPPAPAREAESGGARRSAALPARGSFPRCKVPSPPHSDSDDSFSECRQDALLGGALSSGEADPSARAGMRLLPAQVARAAPWRCSLEMQRGAGSRKGAGDLRFHPQKLLLPSCCLHFRLSAAQGLFSNPGPLLTSTLCLQATEDAEFLRAEEHFVLATGNKLQGHEHCLSTFLLGKKIVLFLKKKVQEEASSAVVQPWLSFANTHNTLIASSLPLYLSAHNLCAWKSSLLKYSKQCCRFRTNIIEPQEKLRRNQVNLVVMRVQTVGRRCCLHHP